MSVSAVRNGLRITSSTKIVPIDHMSIAPVYERAPKSSSGGRYQLGREGPVSVSDV